MQLFALAFSFKVIAKYKKRDQRQTVVCPWLFKDDWRRLSSEGDERGTRSRVRLEWFLVM